MILQTEQGEISLIDEPTYSFGSADNVRSYPFAKSLDVPAHPVSVHGVLLDGEPLAVFGATGGATGVHYHSALYLNGALYLAVADRVVCLRLHPFEFSWALRIDTATCFGIYFHYSTGSLISHGELDISRFTEDGEIVWQSGGRDIFTGEFTLGDDAVSAIDFNGAEHRFRYSDGRYEA
jgi:hypothetical protein